MQWITHTSLFSASSFFNPSSCMTALRALILAGLLSGTVYAQEEAVVEAEAESPRQKDPFDYEADFIDHLLNEGLFEYANLALSEARSMFPELADRVQVVEVSTLLRQGKTQEVETILDGKNLASDMKSQAMLLQLAMTYDAMGNDEAAMTKYQQFLKLNENKEIDDPDVLRYFASAALRLSVILKDDGKYEEAAKVLDLVVKTSDDTYLQRKFLLMAAQIRLDQAFTQSGKARTDSLAAANKKITEILWGGNDNFFYMAMGMRAWMELAGNKPEEALETLKKAKVQAIEIEKDWADSDVPKSEYPRAIQRYVEGLAQWDLAKTALKNGEEAASKKLAIQAAGNLYNTFLRYEGNEYADRAALDFEDLNKWVIQSFGGDGLKRGESSPRVAELMFKRELDLAAKLFREEKAADAEEKLLQALASYPETKYTLTAYDTLSRIWISQNEAWELFALTRQVAEGYPDQDPAAKIMLRVGKKMADEENLEGFEQVIRDFGRNFPSQPNAPGLLFRVGNAASERGDQGMAQDVYAEILELYPQSDFAIRVLRLRADEALKSENYEEAIKAFEQVRDQSRDPLEAAYAKLRIADSKLSSGDPELEKNAIPELIALRKELEDPNSSFAEEKNREQSQSFLQNVRYRIGQVLLRQAGREQSDELRTQAATELNSFLEDYPDNKEQAPDVMYNLGRLYLQQGKFDEATKTFDALASKYPESEAGKDALYSLVKAALEEGQVDVAQQAVQRMVAQPEAYEVEKIFKVAQLMLDNERWAEARDSFKLVLDSQGAKENDAMRQRALNGMGRSSLGAGNLDLAAESFQSLIDQFPTSTLVMEAGVSLSDLYLMKDPAEPANSKVALEAVNRILASRPDPVGKARMDIALGRIYIAEGEPNKALANWYGVALTEPKNEKMGDLVREAIQMALTEAQAQIQAGNQNRWNLVIELTDQYIKNFPMDKVADDMRNLNIRAINEAP